MTWTEILNEAVCISVNFTGKAWIHLFFNLKDSSKADWDFSLD